MNKNNNNFNLSVLDEEIEELRQGDFDLTVNTEEGRDGDDSFNSWDTLLGIPSEELNPADLDLEPCGYSLKWKDTLD